MKPENINDVADKLSELQGELEDIIDSSYNVNDIAYELIGYAVISDNPKLKNFIVGFDKLRDMAEKVHDDLIDLKAAADDLSDGVESETEEEAKEPTK